MYVYYRGLNPFVTGDDPLSNSTKMRNLLYFYVFLLKHGKFIGNSF